MVKYRVSCRFWIIIIIITVGHEYLIMGEEDDNDHEIHGQGQGRGRVRGHCIEEERKSLMEFKAAWQQVITLSNYYILPSWVDDHHDCCDGWERVACDPVTGRVLQLSLQNILGEIDFNSTRTIELIGTGLEKLSTLKQLENLDISTNQLPASVLSYLNTLKSLKSLAYSSNYLSDDGFSSKELESLLHIEELDISMCSLTPEAIMKLSAIKQLKSLNIGANGFNSSVLKYVSSIQSLEVLDLSNNYFFGERFSSKECEPILKLKKLKELSLSRNNDLYNTSSYEDRKMNISCLGSLPSLRSLSLSGNRFMDGLFLGQDARLLSKELIGLESLQQIEKLDLSNCGLTNKGGDVFSKMIKLNNLDLSWNNLKKDVLVTLGALSSLQFLNLSGNSFQGPFTNQDLIGFENLEILNLAYCGLNGTIPAQYLCKMNKLKELDLSNNDLKGEFPICLNELLFLRRLNVHENQLSGNISSSLFRNLNFLEYIDLRDNNLEGSFSMSTFANLSKLQSFMISSKSDKLVIETNEVDWVPKFQLKTLILSNCSLKLLPKFLLFQKNLWLLDLSHNRLGDSFPNWLVVNNTGLQYLHMQNNNLSGSVHMPKNSIIALDVSRNNLSSFFNFSWSIDFIDISHNKMSGHIPRSSTGNLSYFVSDLIMRNNSFSGPFPCELVALYTLDISYNSFTGAFFSCPGIKELTYLNLYGNNLTGVVPETVFNSQSLNILDIGENSFSGKLPNFIKNQSHLQVLSLRGNDFTGAIPHQLCQLQMLNLLDLSQNFFSGPIPSCFGDMNFGSPNNGYMTYSESLVEGVQIAYDYKGDVEIYIKYRVDSYAGTSLQLMSGLDLSCNNLEGEIPNPLGNLSYIRTLNLSHNWLSGPIPQTFSNLTQIESLDLSHNNLSGEIPSNLVDLHFIGTFSVVYNNLSGRLPDMKGQFSTFTEGSYAGNPFLCGLPLKKDCKINVKKDNDDDHHYGDDKDEDEDESWYTIDREDFLASFMGAYIVYILGFITVLWINTRWRNMWFNFIENILFSSYYFLLDAFYKCFRIRI